MERRIRVRLTADLTSNHPGLVPGVEGTTIGRYGMWSRGSDRFVGVAFPGITTLDVLWESLEIIDNDWLREVENWKQAKKVALKSATNVVLTVGPRGGFRWLPFEYVDADGVMHHESNGLRESAEELQKLFGEWGIPIKRVVQS